MHQRFITIAALALLAGCATETGSKSSQEVKAPMVDVATAASAHAFTLTAIDGADMPMNAYAGKVVLLVNTASKCGFTPQYEGLQALYKQYEAKGFTVIGVPSGDFMGQEFGDNKQIQEFCDATFGITFPMTEKAHVKGSEALPIYQWARLKIGEAAEPKWNFHKILIGKDGQAIAAFGSRTRPDSAELTDAVEKALKG
jgi:glutathione peroxidase